MAGTLVAHQKIFTLSIFLKMHIVLLLTISSKCHSVFSSANPFLLLINCKCCTILASLIVFIALFDHSEFFFDHFVDFVGQFVLCLN